MKTRKLFIILLMSTICLSGCAHVYSKYARIAPDGGTLIFEIESTTFLKNIDINDVKIDANSLYVSGASTTSSSTDTLISAVASFFAGWWAK